MTGARRRRPRATPELFYENGRPLPFLRRGAQRPLDRARRAPWPCWRMAQKEHGEAGLARPVRRRRAAGQRRLHGQPAPGRLHRHPGRTGPHTLGRRLFHQARRDPLRRRRHAEEPGLRRDRARPRRATGSQALLHRADRPGHRRHGARRAPPGRADAPPTSPAYRPIVRERPVPPVQGLCVCVPPPPSSGVALLQLLAMAETPTAAPVLAEGETSAAAWTMFAQCSG